MQPSPDSSCRPTLLLAPRKSADPSMLCTPSHQPLLQSATEQPFVKAGRYIFKPEPTKSGSLDQTESDRDRHLAGRNFYDNEKLPSQMEGKQVGKPQRYLTAILSFSSIQLHFFSPSRRGKRMPSKLPLFSATRRPCRSLAPSFLLSGGVRDGAGEHQFRKSYYLRGQERCAVKAFYSFLVHEETTTSLGKRRIMMVPECKKDICMTLCLNSVVCDSPDS